MPHIRKSSCAILLMALGIVFLAIDSCTFAQSADGTESSHPVAVVVSRNHLSSQMALNLRHFDPDLSAGGQGTLPPTWIVHNAVGDEIASGAFEYG